jgi:hypothetical protein
VPRSWVDIETGHGGFLHRLGLSTIHARKLGMDKRRPRDRTSESSTIDDHVIDDLYGWRDLGEAQ